VDDDTTIDHYKCIYVNGSKVPDSGLAVESGSLKVSLKAEYLETLALGTHTIKAEFDDGSAEAKFMVQAKAEPGNEPGNNNNQNNNNTSGDTKKTTPVTNTTGSRRNVVSAQGSNAVVVQSTTNKAVPKTGDNNMNALWILLTIIPAAAIAGMVIVRRKKTQE
jgi:LPXTG-motif cell wall-anchored protein